MVPQENSLLLLQRVAAGQFDDETRTWLSGAADMYIKMGGELDFHVHCKLPASSKKMRMLQRDLYLHELVGLLHPETSKADRPRHAQELASMIKQFISRGRWRLWRDKNSPPDGAGPEHVALFYIARSNRGNGLSRRYIAQLLGGK